MRYVAIVPQTESRHVQKLRVCKWSCFEDDDQYEKNEND